MKNKLMALIGVLAIGTFAVGCSSDHDGGEGASGGSVNPFSNACGLQLETVFEKTWHKFLKTQCASCHVSGETGKGRFADGNLNLAFNQFMLTGPEIVKDQALNVEHKPPASGPQNQGAIDNIDGEWNQAVAAYEACQKTINDGNQNDPDLPDDDSPIIDDIDVIVETRAKAAGQGTLTWDLASETVANSSGLGLSGVQISVEVSEYTSPSGERSYQLTNPRLTAGNVALRLRYLEVSINGKWYNKGTTFKVADRRVPANKSRKLATGTLIIDQAPASGDQLAIGIGELTEIDFDPPTFQELTASGGVFGANCLGCHSGNTPRAGLDLTDYQYLTGLLYVTPYEPTLSEVYNRMNSQTGPMPPTGNLPTADRKKVLDWILDGAPSGAEMETSVSGLPATLSANNNQVTVTITGVVKVNGAATINLTMNVTDPDQMDELDVSINNNPVIVLFGDQGVGGNDNQTVNLTIDTPASDWRDGTNTLVFRHLRTNGATINSISVGY